MIDFEQLFLNASKYGCLVVGDIILDKYIIGDVSRISPEAPIPVLRVEKEKSVLGGAANAAGNVQGYHVKTFLCGLLGYDNNAEEVKKIIAEKGIHFIGEKSEDRRTTVKTRVIGMNQQLVRMDCEDVIEMSEYDEEKLITNIEQVLDKVNSVVLSDYNKGVCTESFCRKVIGLCEEREIPIIVDPKSDNWMKYEGATLITPNFKEFKAAVGHDLANIEIDIEKNAKELFEKYKIEQVLVTRSQYGMTIVQKEEGTKSFQTVQQEVYDVSGAGDTVIGTIAALLACNCDLREAVEISNYAAGLAVSKSGTYTVTLEEVLEYMSPKENDYRKKVISRNFIEQMVQKWKINGEKIVFTNGCFDILHIGHIEYMNKASNLGTKMIVGLNSDASVKRIKGLDRPINNEQIRADMLAALQCVDAVVIFEEDTPEELIKKIYPDYLVKGGDYNITDIVGKEYAGEVRVIPFTEGYSTTNLIQKIRYS